jgi:hypothetical protein
MYNRELCDVYSFPDIRVIKLKTERSTGHVAIFEDLRNVYEVWSENLMSRDLVEGLGLNGRIILKWALQSWGMGSWSSRALWSLVKMVVNLWLV